MVDVFFLQCQSSYEDLAQVDLPIVTATEASKETNVCWCVCVCVCVCVAFSNLSFH